MKTEKQIANERHMKIVAGKLNGREYGSELTDEEAEQLKSVGLVVAFGYSDDNVEFRGAIDEEIGVWEEETLYLFHGTIMHIPCGGNPGCPLWIAESKKAKTITVQFLGDGWKFYTDIPHEKFTIMEDGEVYGEGIVFAYEDVGGKLKCRCSDWP